MKVLLLTVFTLSFSICQAQIGIGTTNPQASLDIKSSDESSPIGTDGILIPQADSFPLTNPTANQDGMLLYITGDGAQDKGFYYWNWIDPVSSSWIALSTIEKIDDLIDAKSDNDGTNNGSSVFLGQDAGINDDVSDNRNVGVGYRTLYNSTTGFNNVANGYNALYNNTIGNYNTANGGSALYNNTEGDYNAAFGVNSLYNNTTGENNTATGSFSMYNNTEGDYNTSNGYRTLYSNTTGSYNSATGNYSLNNNVGGNHNTAHGNRSLNGNTEGDHNTAIGSLALYNNTDGIYNAATGSSGLYSNIDGDYNTANGARSLLSNTNGSHNTAVGNNALYNNTTGDNNLGLGKRALYSNTIGSNNVAVGFDAGHFNTGSNSVFIGYLAGYNEVAANRLYIENSNSATPLIYGEFDTDVLTFNGNVTVSNANATHTNATLSLNNLSIADLGSSNLGLDGNIIPYGGSISGYDLGNNNATEHWDDVVADDFVNFSDRRLKNSITQIPYGLQAILNLKPVTYRYNDDFSVDNRFRLGLIAQEVENVIPEVVFNEDIDGNSETGEKIVTKSEYKSMSYVELIPVLIRAIQEQNEIIEGQSKKIERLNILENKFAELEKRLLNEKK